MTAVGNNATTGDGGALHLSTLAYWEAAESIQEGPGGSRRRLSHLPEDDLPRLSHLPEDDLHRLSHVPEDGMRRLSHVPEDGMLAAEGAMQAARPSLARREHAQAAAGGAASQPHSAAAYVAAEPLMEQALSDGARRLSQVVEIVAEPIKDPFPLGYQCRPNVDVRGVSMYAPYETGLAAEGCAR